MFYHADSPTSPVIESLKIVACFITQNSGQIGQYNLLNSGGIKHLEKIPQINRLFFDNDIIIYKL